MRPISSVIDFMTMGSGHPIRRLIAYYAVLGVALFLVTRFIPSSERLLVGKGLTDAGSLPRRADPSGRTQRWKRGGSRTRHHFAHPARSTTALILLGTLLLMLPVSWVYMSARNIPGHSQAVVQTLIILPLVVAGIVLMVRDSLALAFSLAGVVAAVRFRTNLKDARDVVYVFLAIAVGLCGRSSNAGGRRGADDRFQFCPAASRGGTTMAVTSSRRQPRRNGRSHWMPRHPK